VPHPWGFGEPNYGVSVVGMLARNAADCAWLYDQLISFDASDGSALPLEVDMHASGSVHADPPRSLRIAWSAQLGCGYAIDADVLAALELRVETLRTAGWQVDVADPSWPADIHDIRWPRYSTQAFLHCMATASPPGVQILILTWCNR
jgi:aspartyl-tRNA(Asn)/glutamyl-tRNA(Gln) amidotransferase subunit A